ncbi:unnamed protein product [Rotaria sordida]|uniref:Ubiquitin-like domain-containing protein n=1 Tax=Rotaria sordida TaxID=392033 RepID=A0A815GSG0_9BILA|nr:unnamed protein product [Rotaria sordida]
MLTGEILMIKTELSETIENIKKKIKDTKKCSNERVRLLFAGKHLLDQYTLNDYHVKKGIILHSVYPLCGGMKIFIRYGWAITIALEVVPNETIESIKKKIQDEGGIPFDQQRLFSRAEEGAHFAQQRLICEDGELKNDRTISDYKIKKESAMYVMDRRPKSIPIIIEPLTGDFFIYELESTDTFEYIKAKIEDEKLIYAGKELED